MGSFFGQLSKVFFGLWLGLNSWLANQPPSIDDQGQVAGVSEMVVPTVEPTKKPVVNNQASDLLAAVNRYRAGFGLSQLEIRGDLCSVAKERLGEIGANFNHDGFQQRLSDGRFAALGYQGIAENLFRGDYEPDFVVQKWDESAGHKENLNGVWTWGCGVAKNGLAVFLFMK